MKFSFFKRIAAAILILSFITPAIALTFPQKAEAQWFTFDAANTVQNTITAANTTASTFSTYSIQFKEFVLDTLATTLVKQLIRQITADVVNWINNGFEGSPAFVTNPGGFFIDVADQITGEFLAKYGGPLTALCSPFSIDIRLALAFKYHPNIPKRYSCTLGQALAYTAGQNAYGSSHDEYLKSIGAEKLGDGTSVLDRSSVNGASIQGFMDGDFEQGGWPAFVSLTTEPQNNYIGAYLTADSELSIQVANARAEKKDEISNGRGFMSWRNPKCKAEVKANNAKVRASYESLENGETPTGYSTGASGELGVIKSENDCPVETPGSLIVDSLSENIAGPLRELQLVDSINEIVNALAAQLVTQTLKGGLKAVSGSGPSDSTSYLNQIQAEARMGSSGQLDGSKNEFLRNVETYLSNTLQFKMFKDQSLNTMIEVKGIYDQARGCYEDYKTKAEKNSSLYYHQIIIAEDKIKEIDDKVSMDVTPTATRLLTEAGASDTRYSTLLNLRDQGRAASTFNELNIPSQQYSQMLLNRDLVSAQDIVSAQQELSAVQTQAAPLKQDAQRRVQECRLLLPATGN